MFKNGDDRDKYPQGHEKQKITNQIPSIAQLVHDLKCVIVMKVAITHWLGRVSPVFDVAGEIMLARIEQRTVVSRRFIELASEHPAERIARLKEMEVDVLICGAVSRPLEAAIMKSGLRVIARICGDVDQVLNAFLDNDAFPDDFLMPGCYRPRQRIRRRQRQRLGKHQRKTK